MEAEQYGNMRVLSKEQNEDRQRLAMLEFCIEKINIILDKQSSKDSDRPGYRRLMRKLKPGDTLGLRVSTVLVAIMTRFSAVAAAYKVKASYHRGFDTPLLDTRQGLDLTGVLISDIILQFLSYVVETEREFIRQRQAAGIAVAKKAASNLAARRKTVHQSFWS